MSWPRVRAPRSGRVTGIDKGMVRRRVLRPPWAVVGATPPTGWPTNAIAATSARWASTGPRGPMFWQPRQRRAISRSACDQPLAAFAAYADPAVRRPPLRLSAGAKGLRSMTMPSMSRKNETQIASTARWNLLSVWNWGNALSQSDVSRIGNYPPRFLAVLGIDRPWRSMSLSSAQRRNVPLRVERPCELRHVRFSQLSQRLLERCFCL
jgi:hypothetical protein